MTATPEVKALCAQLVPDVIPEIVEIKPSPGAVPDECTENVARVVADHGGEIVYGWKLVEPLPGLLAEAEFHAVLVNDQGDLLDVTPSAFPASHTVFLPDPKLTYDGQQVNSVRVALVDDPLIAELIEAFDADFEAMNRGELANQHGTVVATPEIEASKARLEKLFSRIMHQYY